MAAPLTDKNTGDTIEASHVNDIKDYIEDGAYRVNTSALEIGSTEVIDSSGYFKPPRIVNPDSNGTPIYASDGTTQIGLIDDSGNLRIKGSVLKL